MSGLKFRRFSVDRIESTSRGKVAVLIDGQQLSLTVLLRQLPVKTTEGSILDVPVAKKALKWDDAVLLPDETKRRRGVSSAILKKLSASDEGGDIKL